MGCPIGLDKVHCQNCYFWRDVKCDYHTIMREHAAKKWKYPFPHNSGSSEATSSKGRLPRVLD